MLVQNNTLRAIKYHCIGRGKGSWHFVQQLMIAECFSFSGSMLVNRLIMHDLKSCKMLLWSVNSSFNLWFLFHIISVLLLGDNVEALHTLIQIVTIIIYLYWTKAEIFTDYCSPTVQHYVTIHVGRMVFSFNY